MYMYKYACTHTHTGAPAQAIEMHKVKGRNIVHRLHLARQRMRGTSNSTSNAAANAAAAAAPSTLQLRPTSPTHKPLSGTLSAPAVQQPVPRRRPNRRQVQAQSQDDGLSHDEVTLRRTADSSSPDVAPLGLPAAPPKTRDDSLVGPRHYKASRSREADEDSELKARRRHSSCIGEADFQEQVGGINHITENDADYAVIAPKKQTSKSDATVDPLRAAKQQNATESEVTLLDSSQSKHGDYIMAYFPGETPPSKPPPKKPPPYSSSVDTQRMKDSSQTRFEYSQVAFGEEPKAQDKEATETKKKKPPLPFLPPAHEGSGGVASPTVAESRGLQAPIPKKRNLPHNKSDPEVAGGGRKTIPRQLQSVPDLQEMRTSSGYVNVQPALNPQQSRPGSYENVQPVSNPPQACSGDYENVPPPSSAQNGGREQPPQLPKVPPR